MTKLSDAGKTVVTALEAERAFARMSDAWRAGSLVATAATVAELIRHDLVRVAGERLALTGAGHGFTVRNERPESANRLLDERVLSPSDGGRRVMVNRGESPLGWLKSRGMVDVRQFEAGERLRSDYEAAALGPRVTMRWDAAPTASGARGPGQPLDPTTAQVAAKRRMQAATAALGNGLGDVAWRVICAGEGLEAAERGLGWPRRAGKLVLIMALDRLADHYGIK